LQNIWILTLNPFTLIHQYNEPRMTTTKQFQQRHKVGVAGSFINQMMSNNATLPEIGKGATKMHYTDRTCYEVVEVSDDKKTVKLERLEAVADPNFKNDIGHQNWILNPTGQFVTVVWRRDAWRIKSTVIRFTKKFVASAEAAGHFAIARALTPEQHAAVYGDDIRPRNVVDGITESAFEYSKINLLFGVKDYYYDWSF
jgi:hypothetical protein